MTPHQSMALLAPRALSVRPSARQINAGIAVLCWLIVAALGALAAGRIAHADGSTAMVAVIALTPLLYLPAWAVAGFALATRRTGLSIGGLVLVALHLVWTVPQMIPWSTAEAARPGAIHLRVFQSNVSQTNNDLRGIAEEIASDHPDVVVLEELRPANLASIEATHVLDRFPWHLVVTDQTSLGMGLWSAVPAQGLERWDVPLHPELRAWLQPPGGPRVRLYAVHTLAPVGADQPALWKVQLAGIRAALSTEPKPLVVVGDLNATWDHRQFQSILHLGLHDAAVVAGRGWEMTWNRQNPIIPPVIRIDHVLVSRGVRVGGIRLGQGRGSDHRTIVADLEVNP